jgi:hypothetical protein
MHACARAGAGVEAQLKASAANIRRRLAGVSVFA